MSTLLQILPGAPRLTVSILSNSGLWVNSLWTQRPRGSLSSSEQIRVIFSNVILVQRILQRALLKYNAILWCINAETIFENEIVLLLLLQYVSYRISRIFFFCILFSLCELSVFLEFSAVFLLERNNNTTCIDILLLVNIYYSKHFLHYSMLLAICFWQF